jgi:hypothetical protein
MPNRVDENGIVIVEPGGTIWRDAEPMAQAAAVEIHADAEGYPAGFGWGLLPLMRPRGAGVPLRVHRRPKLLKVMGHHPALALCNVGRPAIG